MQSTEIQTLTLDAPVTTVTLLEDRAQVQRIGKVSLTAGLWRVTVDRVAPILSDKSLRAEFTGAELIGALNAKVNDVRVRRRMLIKESDRTGLIEELKKEWRSQYDQYQVLTEDRQYLEEQFEQIGMILAKALQELPIDAAWGQVDPMAWRSQIQPIFQRLRDIRSDILNTYHTQTQLQEAIARLVKRIQTEASPDTIYTAYLEADLAIAQTGEYELAFDYVVPNALWRPYHQAQLQMGDNSQLTFRTDGCIWQNTGEDWLNVDLVFSTARASLGTEPPLLADDLLNIREKSKKIAVELRDQTVKTTGLGSAPRTNDTVDLPSVDDGGEVRSIRATRKANIPSDGRPYRVPLFQFQSSAKIEHVLMPELALQVVLKSEQTNNANLPILAGPVDLVRSTEYVGRTTVSFIAPQEKFALGWGTDATMRVQRTTSQKRDKNHLTQWNTITNSINIFLSNIGDEVRKIAMTERVPVSELEKVKIEVVQDETSDRLQPDANGFCNWHLQLPPYSQAKVTLVYKVAAAPDVEGL
jgi:uncharacterized protein (TIGR02231 family)